MSLRTPLSKVRGHGSAKSGAEHFWRQRVTAVANIPLMILFVVVLVANLGGSHATVAATMSSPPVALLFLLIILSAVYHMYLGMQVIIEDYVSSTWQRITCLLALKLLAILPALVCVYALIKLVSGA